MKKLFIVVIVSFLLSTFSHFATSGEHNVNLDFRDISIHDAFRLLSEHSDIPIILSTSVQGSISINLKNFDFYSAFDYLASTCTRNF